MFKKLAIILSAVIVMCSVQYFSAEPLFYEFMNESGSYEIYLENYSSSADIVMLNDISTYKTLSNISGESCRVRGHVTKEEILNSFNARLVFEENHANGTSYYAYAQTIKYRTIVRGENINLHVFVGENGIKVGSPIIFGSF